jgi:hypothetical protein
MLYLASNKPIGSGQYLSFYVKWDGTQTAGTGYTTDWGTESVAYPITVGTSGGGNITLVSGRRYYVVQQTKYGHISDLNPVSASTGPLTNQSVPLSNILYNDDTQVTSRLLLATADGGDETLLYLLATLPDNSVSTYTDNVAEADLLASPIYQELDPYGNQIGVADNTPPPFEYGAASFPSYSSYLLLHNGRLYLAAQQSLFFSKNLGELTTSTNTVCGKWEECWPADYVMPVSTEAENITGLLSDGVNLYIGTQRHIRRLQGDGPTGNNPFVYPQVLFNNVGVVNQEVWVRVFQEGAPVGAIWLTPDGRIIMSDFQSYQDIGHPVQDVLNNINYAVCSGQAQTACFAEYFTSDAYDLYMLAVPTGNNTTPDTVLVFDLRGGQWGVWTLTDTPSVFHCNITQTGFPNWYMGSSSIVNNYTTLWRFDSSTLQDRDGWAAAGVAAVPVVSAVQTSWMHFGMPVDRKWLNELEVITEDPNSLISVYGASIGTDFVAPISIVTNQALIQSPFGPYKVYLLNSTNPCKYRYYSFKFQSSSTSVAPMLEAFNAEVIPIHKL